MQVRGLASVCFVWGLWVPLAALAQSSSDGSGSSAQEATPGAPVSNSQPPAITSPSAPSPRPIRYILERVEFRGNERTRKRELRRYVRLRTGHTLDVDDPAIEAIRWRLLGTGWFHDVRFRLRRGSQRGRVVLVVEVEERNTLVIQRGTAGVSKVVRHAQARPKLEPYAGIGVAESNLFGLGIGLAATAVVSSAQYGLELSYSDPRFAGADYELNVGASFNRAREFFGKDDTPLVSITCPPEPKPCSDDVKSKTAVVGYRRAGLEIGTGHDISGSLRYTLDWRGELIQVLDKPDAASTVRGADIVPIDFRIHNGNSRVSSVILSLIYDRRDDPGLPARGQLVRFRGMVSGSLVASSYDFTRFEASIEHWSPLPWGHVLRFGGFAGAIFGRAPFFYHLYASDLSNLIPSRLLGLNLDHRGPPDLLGTAIAEMRKEQVAGRIDLEYSLPLQRGASGVYAVDVYALVGLYALAQREDLRFAVPGYEGLARAPVDLTFDFGVRVDTAFGLFQLGFSNVLGFLPLFESDEP